MPYGSPNGGGGPGLPGGGQNPGAKIGSSTNGRGSVISTIKKSVSYVASGSKSNQILAIAGTDSHEVTTADAPKAVRIANTGSFPVVAMLGYQQYVDENTENNTIFVHTLLLPGETINPNMRGIISTQGSNVDHTNASFADRSLWNLDGEVVDYTVPNVNLYTDSTADVDHATASTMGSDATHTTLNLEDGHSKLFKVGDLIRLENEICEVTAVGTGADLANSTLTIIRGLYGSTAATHADDVAVRFPFFNEYYDYDRVLSGNTQLVQTDSMGRFEASNFFGYGRVSSTAFGLVPGSICIRFYTNAYQEIPMGGTGVAGGTGGSNISITSSTSSMLSTSTEYSLNLIIDDSVETTVSFTTDTSNVNFGGTNGIISKIQTAINTATRTAGNNLFGYSCSVSIANGALRFTSDSHLLPHDGTNGSRMEIKDGAGGTNVLTGAAGIFPDALNIRAVVVPQLPDLEVYDPITYATSPNMTNICYDDSHGNLVGAANGKVNYETGKVSFLGLANASFEVSVVHNSPFSGKLDANKEDANTLKSVHANALNKNMTSEIIVTTFN